MLLRTRNCTACGFFLEHTPKLAILDLQLCHLLVVGETLFDVCNNMNDG